MTIATQTIVGYGERPAIAEPGALYVGFHLDSAKMEVCRFDGYRWVDPDWDWQSSARLYEQLLDFDRRLGTGV